MKANKFHKITEKQRQQKLVEVLIRKANLKKTSRNYGIIKELVSKLKIPEEQFYDMFFTNNGNHFRDYCRLTRSEGDIYLYEECSSFSSTSNVRLECGILKHHFEDDKRIVDVDTNAKFDVSAPYLAVIKTTSIIAYTDKYKSIYILIGYFPEEKFEFEK